MWQKERVFEKTCGDRSKSLGPDAGKKLLVARPRWGCERQGAIQIYNACDTLGQLARRQYAQDAAHAMADENRLEQSPLRQKAGEARRESLKECRSALYGCLSVTGQVHREDVL